VKTEKAPRPATFPDVGKKKFAIVVATFYADLAAWLEDGAFRGLRDCGVAANAIDVVRVPGCFELPVAARRLIDGDDYDGVVALGVVVRGETPHFDYVAGECARGIMSVQVATGVPIGFGVLTTDTIEQAEERADPARGDKGYDAAIAAATVAAIEPKSDRKRVGFR
jgi:6,7-dimethyl-8-ribityllumazine synthase